MTVTLGPATVVDEGVVLWAQPVEALVHIRRGVPAEDTNINFQPHVSLAYANGSADATGLVADLAALPHPRHIEVTVSQVDLVRVHQADRAYVWDPIASVDLGSDI